MVEVNPPELVPQWNAELITDPSRWLDCARRLLTAATVLDAHTATASARVTSMEEGVPMPSNDEWALMFARIPNTMMMAFALECCLKGLIARTGPPPTNTHDLGLLWKMAYPDDGRDAKRDEDLWTLETMIYLGRYPAHFKLRGEDVVPAAPCGSFESFRTLIERPFIDLDDYCTKLKAEG